MSDSRHESDFEQQQSPVISASPSRQMDANRSQSISPRRKIRLYDTQTKLPVGIYLNADNTLSLQHVQLIYPHATSVKGRLPDQNESDLFPCENGKISPPTGVWPDGILEPTIPSNSVQPLSSLLETASRGYVVCKLTNPHRLNLSLDAELLVDWGCSIELILPSKEIRKLGLQKENAGVSARGFNNCITVLPQYNDLKVVVDLKNPVTNEMTTKTAMVAVFERASRITSEIAIQCEPTARSDSVSTLATGVCTPERPAAQSSVPDNCENIAILKLSPLKYPVKDGDQYGILGYPALKKLNIGIHFGGNYIFGIERRFEHIPSLSMSVMI